MEAIVKDALKSQNGTAELAWQLYRETVLPRPDGESPMLPPHLVNGVPVPKKEGILFMAPNNFQTLQLQHLWKPGSQPRKNQPRT
eukprot:222341-Pleurochrysis_carterae.AAC.3